MLTIIPAPGRCFLLIVLILCCSAASAQLSRSGPSSAGSESPGVGLAQLLVQGRGVNGQLSSTALDLGNQCQSLHMAVRAVKDYSLAISTFSDGLAAPQTLDPGAIAALDELSTLVAGIASNLPALSGNVATLALGNDLAEFEGAIETLLALSDAIGVMADRILEMADKILLMADNIGLMADRMLATQRIQTTNLLLTQSFILNTQSNMLSLSASFDTTPFNLLLRALAMTGNRIREQLDNTPLNSLNLSSELASAEGLVQAFQQDVISLVASANATSASASSYIDADTLALLGDLSTINAALSLSLLHYSDMLTALAPDLASAELNDALYSMLRLSADIGLMGNRIVEMGDRIFVMADNIGIMADRIVTTQTLQQDNLVLTQSNLTRAQNSSVALFAAFGL